MSTSDIARREFAENVRPFVPEQGEPTRSPDVPPHPDSLIATDAEIQAARLAPRCIVRHLLYADVAQLVAPGGTGKTTLLLYEAVQIALGRTLWGLDVESPGWTLIVTAEDQRERILARLREILDSLDLSPGDRAVAVRSVRVWDVTGRQVRLVTAADGNIMLTTLADSIVETYRTDPPAVVVFDPLVSFGASEAMVNDNEQGLITAARRIVRGLDCCVRLVHHTGKANARDGSLDQYSGRGGSALADGTRMTTIMQGWRPGVGSLTPPPTCTMTPDASITVMARAKLSYAPPDLPLIWIRRTGFQFEHFTPPPSQSADALRSAQCGQLERFLVSELQVGRRHTSRTLEDCARDLDMTRQAMRGTIERLRLNGRIVSAPLPAGLRQGRRTEYLHPVSHCAEGDGAIGPENSSGQGDSGKNSIPSIIAPPLRDSANGALTPPFADPVPSHCADELRRNTAQLAQLGEKDLNSVSEEQGHVQTEN